MALLHCSTGGGPSAGLGAGNETGTANGGAGAGDGGTNVEAIDAGAGPRLHRPAATTCDATRASIPQDPATPAGFCRSDADCTEGRNGRCFYNHGLFGPEPGPPQGCSYDECATDQDCAHADGGVCACRGGPTSMDATYCVPAGCHVDADCGDRACSPSPACLVGVIAGYFCHTAADVCVNDSDCPNGGYCAFDGVRWACNGPHCVE